MLKIKKNDTVQAVKGKDKGKKGRLLEITHNGKRALVEGINLVKKHTRKSQKDQQGGVKSIEASISVANLMIVCKQCDRPVRIGFNTLKDGTKTRICKSCKEAI